MSNPTPARPALDAMAEESIYTKRTITHDEAVEIAHRLINSHFNKEPCARASIPARPDYDDDLLILAFIEQQRRSLADMRGALVTAEKQLVYSLTEAVRRRANNGDPVKASDIDLYVNQNTAVIAVRAALARSAP